MEDKNISEQESLELISRMIKNTQRKMEEETGTPMLIWGGATVITTILVWIAIRMTHNHNWNFLWFLIPIIGCIGMLFRKKPTKGIRTYVDKMVGYVWLVLGITGFILSCLSIFSVMWTLPILFIIIIIMGMGTVLTGLMTEFKPLVVGGIIGLALGVIQYLSTSYDLKILFFALAFFIMMVIPGCILNYKTKKHV